MAKKVTVAGDTIAPDGSVPISGSTSSDAEEMEREMAEEAGVVETEDGSEENIEDYDQIARCRCGASRFQIMPKYEFYRKSDGEDAGKELVVEVDTVWACWACHAEYSEADGTTDKLFVSKKGH